MEQQLDHSLLRTAFTDKHFIQMVRRYAVVLLITIIAKSLLRQGVTFIPMIEGLTVLSSLTFAGIMTMGAYLVVLVVNLITALIVLGDMRKTESTSWLIFFLTLLANEVGVIFFLISFLTHSFRRSV